MKTFISGIIGLFVTTIASIFAPTFYSYSWGYANIEGDAVVSNTSRKYFSLHDLFGVYSYIILGIILFSFLFYAIMLVIKKDNVGGLLPLLFVLAILPLIFMLLGAISGTEEGKFIKSGSLVIGAGTNACISMWWWICFIFLIVFYFVTAVGVAIIRKKIERENKNEPEMIKVKTKESINYNEDTFSL